MSPEISENGVRLHVYEHFVSKGEAPALVQVAETFGVAPATLQSMYAPEFTAYSAGVRLGVAESD